MFVTDLLTMQQRRVLRSLLEDAKRQLWLAQTSGRITQDTLRKRSERVSVLTELLGD